MQLSQTELPPVETVTDYGLFFTGIPGGPVISAPDPTIWEQIENVLTPVTQFATRAAEIYSNIRAASPPSHLQTAQILAMQQAQAQAQARAAAAAAAARPGVFGLSNQTILLLGAGALAVYLIAKKRR